MKKYNVSNSPRQSKGLQSQQENTPIRGRLQLCLYFSILRAWLPKNNSLVTAKILRILIVELNGRNLSKIYHHTNTVS